VALRVHAGLLRLRRNGLYPERGFGSPVVRVHRDAGRPVSAQVGLRDSDASDARLSSAVGASGAAFDSLAAVSFIDLPGLSDAAHWLGGRTLNRNLGVDVPNFARSDAGVATFLGYLGMATFQRIPRFAGPNARWLKITDGGHYEDLGVLAVSRRGIRCILAGRRDG